MAFKVNQRLDSWVNEQLAQGRFGFALDSLREALPAQTEIARKFALKRLSDKGEILSIYKGYYIILPPQYAEKGVLPPPLFLDAFMKAIRRPYYVSLLNAAAYHGASHQQPQEYLITTTFPVMRPISKKGLKLNFISIKTIPEELLEKRKTESGYINISSPGLTAADLVQYEKRIGGLNRAVAVLEELQETLTPADFNALLVQHAHVTALQRLGYLLEFICHNQELSDSLYKNMQSCNLEFFRIPLKTSAPVKGFSSENRWKVIVNTTIELEE
ncbi:MAG: hypothetical protein HUU34_09890 [Saprospiraceae bacterium]|jgi:predicted transcriptional regulator of viral defense system|nr:hypothetical protein [Saprospiraceae bacterium]